MEVEAEEVAMVMQVVKELDVVVRMEIMVVVEAEMVSTLEVMVVKEVFS